MAIRLWAIHRWPIHRWAYPYTGRRSGTVATANNLKRQGGTFAVWAYTIVGTQQYNEQNGGVSRGVIERGKLGRYSRTGTGTPVALEDNHRPPHGGGGLVRLMGLTDHVPCAVCRVLGHSLIAIGAIEGGYMELIPHHACNEASKRGPGADSVGHKCRLQVQAGHKHSAHPTYADSAQRQPRMRSTRITANEAPRTYSIS